MSQYSHKIASNGTYSVFRQIHDQHIEVAAGITESRAAFIVNLLNGKELIYVLERDYNGDPTLDIFASQEDAYQAAASYIEGDFDLDDNLADCITELREKGSTEVKNGVNVYVHEHFIK